jgi:hypothetical protein
MPVTVAKTGLGLKFGIGNGVDGGSVSYVDVGEITSVTAPEISRETHDASHLNSPDKFREHIAGMLDTGTATVAFNYVPSASDALYTAALAEKGDFEIIFPGGVKMQFMGVVITWKPGEGTTGVMIGEMTIKGTGKPTFV